MAKTAEGELDRDPVLHEIVERLVAAYQPEHIYLFGSKARGNTNSTFAALLMTRHSSSLPR